MGAEENRQAVRCSLQKVPDCMARPHCCACRRAVVWPAAIARFETLPKPGRRRWRRLGFHYENRSKFKAPKTPLSHGLTGFAAIESGAESDAFRARWRRRKAGLWPETGSRAASSAANDSPGARGPFAACSYFVFARQPNRMAASAGNLREMA